MDDVGEQVLDPRSLGEDRACGSLPAEIGPQAELERRRADHVRTLEPEQPQERVVDLEEQPVPMADDREPLRRRSEQVLEHVRITVGAVPVAHRVAFGQVECLGSLGAHDL